jgi:hypothetical protein
MELIEQWRCLEEDEVERVTEDGQLAILVGDISRVLMDHGMPPILGIPRDPGTCYTMKCIMEECGWMELITCWKITWAGKKANPVLRVNPGYNG